MHPRVARLVESSVAALITLLVSQTFVSAEFFDPPGGRAIHHWYVPREHLPKVTKGHLPVRAAELDSLLAAGQLSRDSSSPIVRATYTARYDNGRLVDGTAKCELAFDAIGGKPLRVLLDCQLAITPQVDEGGPPLGCDALGRPVAKVAPSGGSVPIEFRWSLANRRPDSSVASFHFVGVRCPFSVFDIDVPTELAVTSADGIVTSGPSRLGQAYRTWHVALGGHHATWLRVAPSEEMSAPPGVVADRQVTRHRLTSQGLELGVEMALSSDVAFDRLEVEVSNDVRLAKALFDNLEATIEPVTDETPSGDLGPDASTSRKRRFLIQFPVRRRTGKLQVFAHTNALVDGPLPRVVPVDAFWKDRSVEVTVPDHLDVTSIGLDNCRWRSCSRVAESHARTLAWQVLANSGSVSLTVRPAEPFVTCQASTQVIFSSDRTSAVTNMALVGRAGSTYELRARISRPWSVESITADQPSALDDWSVESNGDADEVVIRLATPLSFDRRVNLQIMTRRPFLRSSASFSGAIADHVAMPNVHVVNKVNAFAAVAPLRIVVGNDDSIMPLEPDELPDASFGVTGSVYVYEASASDASPTLRLQRGNVPWSAAVSVDNYFHDTVCEERWRVECLTEAEGLNEVSIRVAPADDAQAEWFADEDRTIRLNVDRVDRLVETEAESHDTYRITIPDAALAKTIYGSRKRKIPYDDAGRILPSELTIVTAPEAKSHGAIVTARCDAAIAERVSSIRSSLDSVSVITPPTSQSFSLAAFRYDANADFKLPTLVYRDGAPSVRAMAHAWIERAQALTRIASSGDCSHRLELAIHNRGRRSLLIGLPDEVTLQRVMVNDQAMNVLSNVGDAKFPVPLPLTDEVVQVVIEFAVRGRVLMPFASVARPEWNASIPVVEDEWRVELPRRFETLPAINRALGSIGVRLFGPLGRRDTIRLSERSTRPMEPLPYQTIRVIPSSLIQVMGWFAFLFSAGCAWSQSTSVRTVLVACGIAVAVAAICPSPFFLLGTGTAWGIAFGLLLKLVPSPTGTSMGRANAGTRFAGVVVRGSWFIVVSATVSAAAQESSGPSDAKQEMLARTPLNVVVPWDQGGKPDGLNPRDVVYLRRATYAELVRQANEAVAGSTSLIDEVSYRVSLARETDEAPFEATDITAEYRIRPTLLARSIIVPIGAGAKSRLTGAPTWNGVAMEPHWNPAGDSLVIAVRQGQVGKLGLSLTPLRGSRGNWLGIQLPVHRYSLARLIIEGPSDPNVLIEVPSALGATTSAGKEVVVDLGPTDSIDLRWRPTATLERDSAKEYLHASIAGGLIRLRSRVVNVANGEPLRQLRYIVPQGVKWTARGDATTTTQTTGGDATELLVEWESDEDAMGRIEFLMQDDLIDGRATIQIPRLTNVVRRQRLLAIQVDRNFALVRDATKGTIGLDEFHAAWPAAPSAEVLQPLEPEQQKFDLTVQPRLSRQVADESNRIQLGKESVYLRYRAEVAPLEGQTFQHTLRVPPQVVIEDVSISNTERVRWSRSDANVVFVRAEEPISGPHELKVEVRVPVVALEPSGNGDSEYRLPFVQLTSALVNRSILSVSRLGNADAQIVDLGSFSPVPDSSTGFSALSEAKPIAVLEGSGANLESPAVRLTSNLTTLRTSLLTAMHAEGSEWYAHVHCIAACEGGPCDSLSFEIPDNWGDSLEISPPLKWEVYRLPDRRRRLRVWLPIGSEQRHELTMTSRIDTEQGVRLPKIRPILCHKVTSWVVLPEAIEQRSLEWATRRLVPESLPKEFASLADDKSLSYRAIGRTAGATLRTSGREDTQPQVQLALADVVVHADRLHQTFQFLMNPNGHGGLAIRMPPSTELISASVSGQVAHLIQRRHNIWQVQHAPTNLPYLLELQCVANRSRSAGLIDLTAPEIVGDDSDQTIWKVQSMSRAERISHFVGAKQVGWRELQLRRLAATFDVINLPAEAATTATHAELEEWNRVWVTVLQQMFGTSDSADNSANIQQPLELLSRLRQQFEASASRVTGGEDRDVIETLAGNQVRLSLRQPPRASSARWVFAAIAIMLPIWASRPMVGQILIRRFSQWLPAIVVAGGFLWLNWLVPSWFGVVIVIFGMVVGLRSLVRWPSR